MKSSTLDNCIYYMEEDVHEELQTLIAIVKMLDCDIKYDLTQFISDIVFYDIVSERRLRLTGIGVNCKHIEDSDTIEVLSIICDNTGIKDSIEAIRYAQNKLNEVYSIITK